MESMINVRRDADGTMNPEELFHTLTQRQRAADLDPLEELPALLGRNDPASHELLTLIGERNNPKEVILAVQASIEQLVSEDGGEPSKQLVSLLSLYSVVIPRLNIRNKTPSKALEPLVSQLNSTIPLVSADVSQVEGRELIGAVSRLVQAVFPWVKANVEDNGADRFTCADMLYTLLDSTLAHCATDIDSSIAQRTFESCFPRLTVRSAVPPNWEQGEQTVSTAMDAVIALGMGTTDILARSSVGSLVLLAHSPYPSIPSPLTILNTLLPTLLPTLECTTPLDESIALLLRTLYTLTTTPSVPTLDPSATTALVHILSPLASMHTSPQIRHQAFQLISLLLKLTPGPARLQILASLASEPSPPQMCAAAVGLIKDAVMETLSGSLSNMFASPIMLRTLGPILFRPRPEDFFSSLQSERDLRESLEASRLVQVLSFYYLLVSRDQKNQTGIRDQDMISSIENSLLAPLRSCLTRITPRDHFGALVSLQIGLERVDSAVDSIR